MTQDEAQRYVRDARSVGNASVERVPLGWAVRFDGRVIACRKKLESVIKRAQRRRKPRRNPWAL
jgi:hypothetical protein